MNTLSKSLVKGRGAFISIAPGSFSILKFKYLFIIIAGFKAIRQIKNKESLDNIISNLLSGLLINKLFNFSFINRAYFIAQERPNWKLYGLGATRRTWINSNDRSFIDNRIVKQLTIVYHDSNKAGKHIDIHFGHLSVVYRVSGKSFENQLKYNKGRLTENSKQLLLNHIRNEIKKNSRVVWNHDHTVSNSNYDWSYDSSLSNEKGYGSGPTRQIIFKDKCEFYHPDVKSSLHVYAPILNPDQGLFIYQIHKGPSPILIIGNLIPLDKGFNDKLHLKLIDNIKDFKSKVNKSTNTIKVDGAATNFTSNNKGFKLFSPRISKVTNRHIEYTYIVPELADKGSNNCPIGIGELVFYKKFFGIKYYLTAAEIGGVLNSNSVRPRNIYPELYVYRMDKWNGKNVIELPFNDNRKLQNKLVKALKGCWKIVKKSPIKNNKLIEGYVAVKDNQPITEGYKFKFKSDTYDWEIKEILFYITEKNRIAGVVKCLSLESGKEFYLGPGSIGTHNDCLDMINNKNKYINKVIKVSGFRGSEGRAAQLIEYHNDKGV